MKRHKDAFLVPVLMLSLEVLILHMCILLTFFPRKKIVRCFESRLLCGVLQCSTALTLWLVVQAERCRCGLFPSCSSFYKCQISSSPAFEHHWLLQQGRRINKNTQSKVETKKSIHYTVGISSWGKQFSRKRHIICFHNCRKSPGT